MFKSGTERSLCSELFKGGKEQVKQMMSQAIAKRREALGLTEEYLDALCFLKEDNLPTCAVFEKDSSQMTASAFCRAASVLGLNLDEILKYDFYLPENVNYALKKMKASNAGIGASCGEALKVRLEKVAPVVLLSKILNEI